MAQDERSRRLCPLFNYLDTTDNVVGFVAFDLLLIVPLRLCPTTVHSRPHYWSLCLFPLINLFCVSAFVTSSLVYLCCTASGFHCVSMALSVVSSFSLWKEI
ncbi:hypothetical protein BJ322DRAFT_1068203 [Thelephora terrestris]|uniref:Uncharacterized protein n=1 Tax=Thelephora terrestris TaxID=56493 RepID=A0A9P6HCT4_9AGAM|nr:hypothetical protein BJ322DRAFT_1068203 [Thelephora terrestris]